MTLIPCDTIDLPAAITIDKDENWCLELANASYQGNNLDDLFIQFFRSLVLNCSNLDKKQQILINTYITG